MSEHAKGSAQPRGPAATRPAAQRIQAKLAVSDRHDPMEREADAVADRVVGGQPAPAVSRMAVPEKKPDAAARQTQPEKKQEPVQRAAKEERKPEPAVQRAAAPEKKEPGVQRAAAPEKKEPPVQRQAAPEKKKEPGVQRAAGPEKKEPPVQRQPAPEKKKEPAVQRAAAPEERKPEARAQRQADEREEVQAKSAGDSGASMGHVAQQAVDSKGAGRPLDPGVRSRIESSLGADMGNVRVHDDAAARAAASALNARAFTHGSDIWMGPGESPSDVRLMAHEATHVVQQGGAAQRMVQRTNGTAGAPPAAPAAAPPDPATLPLETGRPNPSASTITFSELLIPPFKMAAHRGSLYNAHKPLRRKRNYQRGNPDQRTFWKNNLSTARIRETLADRVRRAHHLEVADASATYVFEVPTRGEGARPFLFGNLEQVARELTTPMWGRASSHPELNFYDVDHIVELQVANWNTDVWANTLDNMELLDSQINQESGRVIRTNIEDKVESFLRVTGNTYGSSVADVKERYELVFNEPVAGGGGARAAGREKYWTRAEIEGGEHLSPVRASSPDALGGHGIVRVFGSETGGLGKSFRWPGDLTSDERTWLKPFQVKAKNFIVDGEGVETTPTLGTLSVNIPPTNEDWNPLPADREITVNRIPGARYAGYVQRPSVRSLPEELRKKGMSPVRIDTVELLPDRGLYVGGAVLPDLPMLRDADIRFELIDGRLRIFKEFTAGELHVPPPFRIDSVSLKLFAELGTGLGAEGRVNFGIERVGSGYLEARVATGQPLGFAGAFDFDSRTFDPARIEVSWIGDVFRASGSIGIPDGKVSGVKRAVVNVSVESGPEGTSITGDGTLEPKVRAIREGSVRFSHSAERGTEIGGTLTLSDDIPNVQGGSVEAVLSRAPDAAEWDLRAHGTVTAGAAGLTATVNVDYHNGLFTVEGQGAYARGMLSGSLTVGATNRALGADGRPTDTIGERIIAYGGGTLTVRIAPWLQGTVGVRFLPNGEIELSGEIALPSSIEIFSRKQIEKSLLNIAVQVPIFPGIVAEIGGGLSAQAGIGPGVIDQLRLGITYNPAHEEQTHVTGDAHLNIPADAGLRLAVRAGIGLGITGASATGGLEIGGMLGLAGAAEAGVHLDWMPGTGLRIDAYGDIHAEPVFRFDISGYVSVRALGFEVYGNTWRFASYEFGSNLRFGVRFPIHYVEGQPFDISLSDVEFTVPDVNPRDILSGLIDRIA